MAVAVGDDQVPVRGEGAAEFIALVAETGVGVVVVLGAAVRAYDRRRREQHLEGRVRGRDRPQ